MARIEIYTKDYCPYCVKAKALLDQIQAPYTEIDVQHDEAKFEEMRRRNPGARTVPQIFIDNAPIGGCDDLYALHQQGRLGALLAAPDRETGQDT